MLPSSPAPGATIDKGRGLLAERAKAPVAAAVLVCAPTKNLVDQAVEALRRGGVEDTAAHYGQHSSEDDPQQGTCPAAVIVDRAAKGEFSPTSTLDA